MNPISAPLILHDLFSKLAHFIPQCTICFCECCYCMSLLSLWELPGKFRTVRVRAKEIREADELVRGEQHRVEGGVKRALGHEERAE